MSIQDLGSIGELFSAIIVLITLIYLAIQVRKTRDMLEVQYFDSIQGNALDMAELELALAATILKANSKAELDPAEEDKLNRFFRVKMQNSLFLYFKASSVGRATDLPIRNFVIWLFENPSGMNFWVDNKEAIELQYQMMDSSRYAVFKAAVDADITRFRSLAGSA